MKRPLWRLRIPLFFGIVAVLSCVVVVASEDGYSYSNRRLTIDSDSSDPYADASIVFARPHKTHGVGATDHARITSILSTTKEMMNTARELFKDPGTQVEANEMLAMATAMFGEVKDFMRGKHEQAQAATDEERLLRAKYASHNIQEAKEDEERAIDITRSIYETVSVVGMHRILLDPCRLIREFLSQSHYFFVTLFQFISFPECVEQFLSVCMGIINNDLTSLGLSTIEMVVHEKRNSDQEGYNKVVIVTDKQAEKVMGSKSDGIVSYPFQWVEPQTGPRTLGVDGKWACQNLSPEECCALITQSTPTPDINGNYLECHIFVPFGGKGNKKRNDRVFIKLSPDGRVHEAPIIQ